MRKTFVNSLPNNKILAQSKLKALADGKINVIQKLKFVSGRVENILGKGENAGYHVIKPSGVNETLFQHITPLQVLLNIISIGDFFTSR